MHILICVFIIFYTWKRANWKKWKEYHSTILFLPGMNLVYNFLSFSSGRFLWKMNPDFLFNHTVTELTYTGVLLTSTVLLFISTYPDNRVKIILHYLKYIVVYSIVETIFYLSGRIEYKYGWSIWHSIAFYFLMFPAIRIHYKKPILAYILFVFVTIFGVWYFKLPIQ